MGKFYSNENFPLETVKFLRSMGHDVLTSMEAGNANQRVPDAEVLRFASAQARCILTSNRKDFRRLHLQTPSHAGIVICTTDSNTQRLAIHIDEKVRPHAELSGLLLKVYEGGN